MAKASDWLALAEENMNAARVVRDASPRSAVSRAYYAAYSAAHAILMHHGERPPTRGNWSHEAVPQALAAVLTRGTGSRYSTGTYHVMLMDCYNGRIQADYAAGEALDGRLVAEAIRDAERIAFLARRMIGGSI